MTQTLKCISPIDGSVFAQRDVLAFDAATQAVTAARHAQIAWAARPLRERIDLVLASAALAKRCLASDIDPEPRKLERPSDHTPVFSVFD